MRPLKRLLHDKRAISAVLSHLLLTVIAVGVMSIATSATYVITTNLRENMGERVIIEDVWFNSASGSLDVYLRNVGKVDIQVSAVYVNHEAQSFDSPLSLKVNEDGWLSIAFDWKSGDVYFIDIVTSRGTHIASSFKAL
jgi:FlaG/FlaF family flagellin (archaellin)